MPAGVSTRRYAKDGLEPLASAAAAISKGTSTSAISRRFVAPARARRGEPAARQLPTGI